MNLWRINIKPANKISTDSREYCIRNSVVGFGWPIQDVVTNVAPSEYELVGRSRYHDTGDKGWYPAWRAISQKMEIDDLVWTRTTNGIYYLGRITSDWRYDFSTDASNHDIVNVRSCVWMEVGTVEAVPGKVTSSFIPRRTLQKIYDDNVLTYSQNIYNKTSGLVHYQLNSHSGNGIFSLLSPDDCEDVVGLYLQLKLGYLFIASSCKQSTPSYEYALIQADTKRTAVVQVKTGNEILNRDVYKGMPEQVFLFATSGIYKGQENPNIVCLNPNDIEHFIFDHHDYLPTKVRSWVTIIREQL